MNGQNFNLNNQMPNNGPKKLAWWWLVIILVIVVILVVGIFWWLNKNQTPSVVNEPTNNNETVANVNANTNEGGRLMPANQRTNEPEAPTETFLALIKKIENKFGVYYFSLDNVQWLTGDSAKAAALADGKCAQLSDCAPQGFYIRNQDTKVVTYEVASDVEIIMQTFSQKSGGGYNIGEQITPKMLAQIFDKNSKLYRLSQVPYNIEIKDGVIQRVLEKYVPVQ